MLTLPPRQGLLFPVPVNTVCLKCSQNLFTVSPFRCLLSTDLGLLLFYPILFCLFFLQCLYFCPLPPSFTSFKRSLLCTCIHIPMQECSAATQHMHRLTQNVEINIFNRTERAVCLIGGLFRDTGQSDTVVSLWTSSRLTGTPHEA